MRSACPQFVQILWEADRKLRGSRHDACVGRAPHTGPFPGLAWLPRNVEPPRRFPVQYAPQLHQPSRTLVVPLLAAVLGAAVATATFALINIEDEAVTVSLPSQAVQSAPPSDAVAGQLNDAGPAEGTAQQIMSTPQGSSAAAAASAAPRYDGGPNEGTSSSAMTPPAEDSAGAQPYGGTRP